jgi:hypothetical protein
MNLNTFELDFGEIVKRIIKYLLEGIAVAVAARYIPSEKMDMNEICLIAFTAASVFAILDMYAPSVSVAARQGAGFALGANTLGGLKVVGGAIGR